MSAEIEPGDCVRQTELYIEWYLGETGLSPDAPFAKTLRCLGTAMRVSEDEIFVEYDDGHIGLHEPDDLEVVEETNAKVENRDSG